MTTVRMALVSDAAAVAGLTQQLGYSQAESEVAARLARVLQRMDQAFLVAETEGRVVGWVHTVLTELVDVESFVLIAGLVVDRDHRRSGLGRTLLSRAEAWAVEQGCAYVRLTSSTTRTEAHRFYRRVGYEAIKTQLSFIKPLTSEAAERVRAFVPRVDDETS